MTPFLTNCTTFFLCTFNDLSRRVGVKLIFGDVKGGLIQGGPSKLSENQTIHIYCQMAKYYQVAKEEQIH